MYFTSDLHLGHSAILKYREQFSNADDHDSVILDMFAKLKKRDVVKILGDFIFDSDKYDFYVEQFKKMPCRIQVVMGNHDSKRLYREDRFEIQLPLYSYKNFWLSHCPIHPQELRNRIGNIHGHLHKSFIDDDRYFEVGLDNNDMSLIHMDKIKETFSKNL